MGYEKRTWDLGRIREVEERHTWTWKPPNMRRKKKEKPTAEAVRKNNQRLMARKRRMQLEMYFDEDDCYMTLTYPKASRPESMVEVQRDWKKLMEYVRKVFKKNGAVLRWIRNIEAGTKGAWHIHAVVKELPPGAVDTKGKPTTTAKLISRLWQKKMEHGRVNTQYLRDDVSALAGALQQFVDHPEVRESVGGAYMARGNWQHYFQRAKELNALYVRVESR